MIFPVKRVKEEKMYKSQHPESESTDNNRRNNLVQNSANGGKHMMFGFSNARIFDEVIMLLKGIDFFCAYEPLKYEQFD